MTEKVPFIWLLHIGVFVVWIPAILKLRKNEEFNEFQKSGILMRGNPVAFFKLVFKNTPTWLTIIALAGFFYATANSALFATGQPGVPGIQNGHYVLQNHGQVIKTLTEQQYHHYKANEARGFSGHWIAFYGIGMAMLFPYYVEVKTSYQTNLESA
ncbi:hypothetical protein QTN47_21870 [Danxiaibacter flavus]|uniref:DUF4149 domain-containing protein n=1 Tax=Danxiaibacter flavus TaxID=3049108 RepID=A0ABV3ZK20_9BACT|nr:hypothetical protein QNM32_21875 [Chitinophagaceae bacterium DXS]